MCRISFPISAIEDHVTSWNSSSDVDLLRRATVGGMTLSGVVHGLGCVVDPDGKTLYFVEGAESFGEPGSSGALMFNLRPPPNQAPAGLGVYTGVKRIPVATNGEFFKNRWRMCALPDFEKFHFHRVVEAPPVGSAIIFLDSGASKMIDTSPSGSYPYKLHLEDGERIHGVFISKSYGD